MADLETYQSRVFRDLLALEARYERQIAAVWRGVLDTIRVQMSKLYERYARKGVLTKAEMTRYNRLATAERQLLLAVDPGSRETLRVIDRLRPAQYQEAFFRHGWAIDQSAGIRVAWGALNKDVVLESLASEFYRISRDRYGVEARLLVRQALNDGLSRGKSYTSMVRDLKTALNTANFRALRILRTEGQEVVNAGTVDAYARAADKGVQGREIWDATLDGNTRPAHGSADGQAKSADGTFTVDGEKTPYPGWEGMSAGNRINCRCRVRYEVEGFAPVLRRTRDRGLVPYQTYTEWAKGREMY